MEKTYRFVPLMSPIALFSLCLTFVGLVMLVSVKPGDPINVVTRLMVLGMVAFILYRQKSDLQRVVDHRLVLNDKGLRYEISGQGYSVAWSECDHRVVRMGRDAQVSAVILVTRNGEWLTLNRFEDIPGILTTIRQRVSASGARGLAETALLQHRWPGFLMGGMAVLGVIIFSWQNEIVELPADQTPLVGGILIAPVVLAGLYTLQRSPLLKLGKAVQQQNSGGMVRRFFINLAVWIAIVFGVLFVLNFVVPRLH